MATAIVTTTPAAPGQTSHDPRHLVCSPDEVQFLLVIRRFNTADQGRLARLMRADIAGWLPYTPGQMKAWTLAEFRSAADSVPLVGEARA